MFSESVNNKPFTTDNTWYDLINFAPRSNYEEMIIYIQIASGHRLTMRAMKFEIDGLPNGGALFYAGGFSTGSVNNIGGYLGKSQGLLKPIIFENGVNTTTSCKMKLYYR